MNLMKSLSVFLLLVACFGEIFAKSSGKYKAKSILIGYGKKSAVNGKIKAKPVSGYFGKKRGYKFVHSYAKSY